ncbi:tape measure protein [Comamonas suwonensis]|uniref:Tape measure protein n=1 Tax=Comamonas suwonensis TaxID=2606214 RepID=A0A843BDF0_9BURK|nr:tape measure protein [Comamonas suwonensis]MBI1625357.1 tape measure protein [Comamonas suwonensis]
MADPKIKYDIEAAVKGAADADDLAKAMRNVGDVLEGDLKQGAADAAAALDALGSKQRALRGFGELRVETQSLTRQLDASVSVVDRLGRELEDSSTKAKALGVAEATASQSVLSAQQALVLKKTALRSLRDETTSTGKRTEEYRNTVDGLKTGIAAATKELKTQQSAQDSAARAARQGVNAEAALRKEYETAIGASARLSAELGRKNMALQQTRSALEGMGMSTSSLAQQEKSLQAAVAQARAEIVALVPAYQQAANASTASTQVQAQNQRTLREGMTSISVQLQRVQNIATAALAGSYFGGMIKGLANTADAYTNLEDRVRLATGAGAQFEKGLAGVQTVALKTNTGLEETGNLFARLKKASEEGGMAAVQAQERALGLAATINQATQLSGASAASSQAALTQLIQGLQSGVLRGEEFNSVMEQAPRLAQALANGLGVTTGELRKLAGEGFLTAETVMRALENQSQVVAREFESLRPTVGRALQNLTTQWTVYVGESNKGLLSTESAAKVINALAQNLDLVVGTLTAAGKAWAAIKISGLVADFARWATSTLAATKELEVNTAAAARNTVAQQANTAASAQNTVAQASNTAATTANTVARAANAKAWGDIGAFTRAAGAAQGVATAATTANTAAVAANAAQAAKAGIVWRGASALMGPWGIAVAALTPEILGLGSALGEQAAKWMGYGKAIEEAERQMRVADEAAKVRAESVRRNNALMEEARSRQFDLGKESRGLASKFDQLRQSGDSAADAIAKIGKDFDLSNAAGIRSATAVLDKLAADGKLSASELQTAWAQALDGKDLAKFEILARQAFASAGQEASKLRVQIEEAISKGASPEVIKAMQDRLEGAMAAAGRETERVAQMMDQTLREAVRRTGLDFTDLQGRMTTASRSVLNDLDVVINGLGRLKDQGVDTGRVLEASFVKALDTADSQQAVEEVTHRIEELRGKLGERVADGLLDQAKTKIDALKDAADKAKPGINSLKEALAQLGVKTDQSFKDVAAKSKEAFDIVAGSGTASARELGDAFKKAADDAIAANKGVAPEWVKSQATVRGWRVEVDQAGKATLVSVNDSKRALDDLNGSTHNVGRGFAGMKEQAVSALQSMGIEAERVSEKVQKLVQDGQMLAAAFQQRQDNWNAELEGSKYMNRGKTNPVDAVPSFSSREEGEAWWAAWQQQYAKDNPFSVKSGGQLGNYMHDMTKFEFDAEMRQVEQREAMEKARKKAESSQPSGGGSGGGTGGTGGAGGGTGSGGGSNGGASGGSSGGQQIDRIVNLYFGSAPANPVPTNQTGQNSLEAMGREWVRIMEQQRSQTGN